jgi:hypothetical protein
MAPHLEIANTTPTARFVGRCEPCARPLARDDPSGGSDNRKVVCSECESVVILSRICGVTTTMVCSGACMDATGPVCECACGGANHAGSYLETAPMLAEAIARFRADQAKRRTAASKAAATRAAAKEAARAEAVQSWRDEHPAEAAWLDAGREDDVFASSLADQLDAKGTLSVAQTDAIVRSIERQAEQERRELEDAAEAAAAVAAPQGTTVVEGEILTVRAEPSPFHYGSEVKMLVRASTPDGGLYRVWATKPAGLSSAGRGDRVHFIAELSRSEDDETFAFAKRPRKARLLMAPAPRPATFTFDGGKESQIRESPTSATHAAWGSGRASQQSFPW